MFKVPHVYLQIRLSQPKENCSTCLARRD